MRKIRMSGLVNLEGRTAKPLVPQSGLLVCWTDPRIRSTVELADAMVR